MNDPDLIAQWVARLYADAEVEIVDRMRRRLAQGVDLPGWELETMGRLAVLSDEALRVIRVKNAEIAAGLEGFLSEAYQAGGISRATALAAGRDLQDYEIASATMRGAVGRIAQEIRGSLAEVSQTILRAVPDRAREIVGETVGLVAARGISKRDALKRATLQFLGEGVTEIKDRAGRSWGIQDYTNMAVRTGANRAQEQGQIDSIRGSGLSLVIVQPGPRACKICDGWAREVLSLDGKTGKISVPGEGGKMQTIEVQHSLDDAKAAGFKHPNCRCSLRAFIPGLTDPKTIQRPPWDEVGYLAQQKQRGIEKRIRDAKMRQAAGDPSAAGDVRKAQGEMRAHLAANPDLKRRSDREQIIRAG